MTREEILNVLRAAAVADALGVPVEGKPRDSYQLTEMVGQGTWHQPAGSWSDDTSLTLCLIQNLMAQGNYDDLLNRFEDYMMNGTMTPRGIVFDIGRTCAHAVRQHAVNQVSATHCGDAAESANGNGALMRLAPLAFVLQGQDNQDNRFALTSNYTTVTHGHPRAVVGSFIYLELLHELLAGHALITAIHQVEKTLQVFVATHEKYAAEVATYRAIFTADFAATPRERIASTGYVVDTLMAAVWVALNHDDLREGLLTAVNLGGDTDTVATVAASLIAFGQPNQPIPAEWWDQTLNHPLLDDVMKPFAVRYEQS